MLFKEDAFICDIDGTLASHVNPDGSLRREHFDYTKVSEDLPIEHVIEVVRILAVDLQPIFVSGREDYSRSDTVNWIRNHVDPTGEMGPFNLYMRENGNYEKDFTLKERIYSKLIAPKYNVHFAIDDRLQVCQMWHRIGVPVFRVGDPDAVF